MAKEKRYDDNGKLLETGEIFYKDGRPEPYYFSKMKDGKRHSCTAKTLDELRTKKHDLICQLDKKIDVSMGNRSLNWWFDEWIENSSRKVGTLQNYQNYYNAHVRNTKLGKMAINEISGNDVERLLNTTAKRKGGISKSSLASIKGAISNTFKYAMKDKAVFINVALLAEMPTCTNPVKKRKAVEKSQMDLFLDYLKQDEKHSFLYPLFVVLFGTGMRIGELLALTPADIDYNNGTIRINKTLNRHGLAQFGSDCFIGTPKTPESYRTIEVSDSVLEALKQQRKARMEQGQTMKPIPVVASNGNVTGECSDLLFLNTNGNCYCETNLRTRLETIIRQQNRWAELTGNEKVEPFTLHETRHTFASLMYSEKVDAKYTQGQLGHKSIQCTMNIYTNLSADDNKSNRERMNLIKIG